MPCQRMPEGKEPESEAPQPTPLDVTTMSFFASEDALEGPQQPLTCNAWQGSRLLALPCDFFKRSTSASMASVCSRGSSTGLFTLHSLVLWRCRSYSCSLRWKQVVHHEEDDGRAHEQHCKHVICQALPSDKNRQDTTASQG